jgi:hypothetical protein
VFEDAERAVRVKASFVGREFSKPQLCKRLGDFRPASVLQLEAASHSLQQYSPVPARVPKSLWKEYEQSLERARVERTQTWSAYRHDATSERRRLKTKYRRQRALIAALPISGADKKHLSRQLSLRQAIDRRQLKQQLASQRKAIQRSSHPGSWRRFVASRARDGDARAIRLLHRQGRQRSRSDHEIEL